MKVFLTTREVGELLDQPEWAVRRVVDALLPPVEKFGHKRLIPAVRIHELETALKNRARSREAGNKHA